MTLTDGAKKYIAKYLGTVSGSTFCFSDTTATTVKYWDVNDVAQTGSTLDAVTTIVKFEGYSYEDKVAETGLIDAAKLTSENGDTALTDADITWIYNHSDGADKYCYTEGATGFLAVDTSPTGASVSVNGGTPTSCGTTPVTACVVPVGAGQTVTITKTGYQTETRTVNITEGDTTDLGTITLTAITGTIIAIGSHPGYCKYWIDKDPDVVAADGTTLGSCRDDLSNIIEVEVSAPAVHTVIYRKEHCTDKEITDLCKIQETVNYEFLGDEMVCEDPTYFGTVSVTVHKLETPSESIPAIIHIGSEYKFIAKGETAVFKVKTPQGGSKSVTVYATSAGRASWNKTITVSDGGTYTVDALMEPQKIEISIVPGEAYISDFGGAKHQLWFVGEIKKPSGDNWVSVDTLYAGNFYARLYFKDRTGGGKTPPPDIYTEKRVIIPGQVPSQRRLYWPYTQADVATQYEIKKAYIGEWILWAELIEVT